MTTKGGGSGRRTSLPPELDLIDLGWGEDVHEAPTVVRRDPRDAATRPIVRSDSPEVGSPAGDAGKFALPPSQRVTAPPPRSLPGALTRTPVRRDLVTEPAPANSSVHFPEDDDIFDRPTLEVTVNSPEQFGARASPPGQRLSSSGIELDLAGGASPENQLSTAPPPPDAFELDLTQVGAVPRQDPAERIRALARSDLVPLAASAQREMSDRFAMGDFSGALEKASEVLARDPLDREANALSAKCKDVLLDMYTSRIAGLHRRILVVMAADQVRWLSLDHRSGFLLSMIDGAGSVDELLDVCGMPRLDALRIICNLLDQRAVELR